MSQFPPRLLVIGTVWPEPKSSAAGIHLLSLINAIQQQGYECHFACPANSYEAQHTIDLSSLQISAHEIQLNDSSFDEMVAHLAPDIVLFDRFMMEEQFSWRVRQACPNALCILDTEDVHSLRDVRRRLINQYPDIDLSISALIQYHQGCVEYPQLQGCLHNDLALREITSMLRMDLSLIISKEEYTFLTQCYPIAKETLLYCPFLIPSITPEQQSKWQPFEQRQDFVFIGNYRHAPNWDAVQYLSKAIWPMIKAQLPQAQCHVYGAYTPAKAKQFHQPKHGFNIQGWAHDAQAVLANARVNLAPLRFGAGLKGKIFDALQVGTPTMMTRIASEGIYTNEVKCIADNTQEYIQSAIELYKDKTYWQCTQQNSLTLLDTQFNIQIHTKQLIERIASLQQTLLQHRSTNFLQAMVNQQQLKATQYMSQWIEAKQIIAQLRDSSHSPEIDSGDV